ncbi:MAG: toxin-antitoxin system YwqK family antitoxin [Chitinophagales bacterium]
MKKITLTLAMLINISLISFSNNITQLSVSEITGNIVEVVRYYETGQVLEKGYIENGKLTGKWLRFDKQGAVIAEANYKKGMKHGVWRIYDESGNLCYELQYKNNVRIRAQCFLEKPTQFSLN